MTESHLRKFQARLCDRVASSRVNIFMQLLRRILKQEFRQGSLERSPAIAINREEEPKPVIDPLSESELSLALSNVEPHYRPLFTTLAYTGARPNEIIALRWKDVDWTNGRECISISKGLVCGVEGKPKTAAATRRTFVLPQVSAVLHQLKDGKLVPLDGYIFTQPNG